MNVHGDEDLFKIIGKMLIKDFLMGSKIGFIIDSTKNMQLQDYNRPTNDLFK